MPNSQQTITKTDDAFTFNSLWPGDVIWWHRTGSILALVMACWLMVPSHYLNQCWLIINQVQWESPEGNLQGIPQLSITKIRLKIIKWKFHSNFQGVNGLWFHVASLSHKKWSNRARYRCYTKHHRKSSVSISYHHSLPPQLENMQSSK